MYPTDRHRDAVIAREPRAAGLLYEASALLHWIQPPEDVVDGRLHYGYAIQELLRTMFGAPVRDRFRFAPGQEDFRDYDRVAFWQVNAVLTEERLDPVLAHHPDRCFLHGIYLEVCLPLVYTFIAKKWQTFRPPMVQFCVLGDLLMKTVYSFPFPPVYRLAPAMCDGGCNRMVFLRRRTHRRFIYHIRCYSNPDDDEQTCSEDSE